MKIKKGFTLAETLITMATIAIVAAIAMPAINHLKPNEEMLMLKKVYYLTGRMVNELINDEDYYPDDDTENKSGFSHVTLLPGAPEAVYHGKTYSGVTKFCGLFSSRMNVKGDINCSSTINKKSTFTAGSAPVGGHFTTADGVVWVLPINNFDRGGADNTKQSIYVDVNGPKPGNCFPTDSNCKKPDRFEIKLDRWGKIYVEDALTREYLSLTNVTKQYADINTSTTTTSDDTEED